MASCMQPSERRMNPVRVADVPLNERLRAANHVLRHEPNLDPYEQLKVRMLAEDPGDLVAWVAP